VWTMSCWEAVAHTTVSSDGLTLMLTMWSSSPTATACIASFHVHTIGSLLIVLLVLSIVEFLWLYEVSSLRLLHKVMLTSS
jgi:hypothetical protein